MHAASLENPFQGQKVTHCTQGMNKKLLSLRKKLVDTVNSLYYYLVKTPPEQKVLPVKKTLPEEFRKQLGQKNRQSPLN